MPETNKIKKEEVKVDLDTSGPEVDVDLPEEKEEKVVEAGTTEQGNSKRSKRRTSKRRSKKRGR
jgi:hypothetical protein